MSSSTSSSDATPGPAAAPAGRRFWLVMLVLAALLLALELGMRVLEPQLSLDIQHIREMPAVAASIREATGPTVLFLGNSLTRMGVDLEVVGDGLDALGADQIELFALYPDDTTVLDWHHLLRSRVFGEGAVPDVIVIGFAYRHLVDLPVRPVQTYRLGRFFTDWSDLGELFEHDVTDLEDRVNVIVSKLSAAFANRERLSARVLDMLPGYRESAQHINDVMIQTDTASLSEAATPPEFTVLARFAARVEEAGSRLIAVAMPTREAYELPAGQREALAAAGVELLDLRDLPGLERQHFADSLHMDAVGAEIYSAALARALAPHLPSR